MIVRFLMLGTLGLLAASCNPFHDELPAPRCRSSADCLPGSRCRDAACEVVGQLTVHWSGQTDTVHMWVVCENASGLPPWEAGGGRLLATATADSEAGTTTFEHLPELRRYLVAWDGPSTTPCGAAHSAVVRVPDERAVSMNIALSRSIQTCFDQPPSLDWDDVLVGR